MSQIRGEEEEKLFAEKPKKKQKYLKKNKKTQP